MNIFTVSLFGHRDISDLRQLDRALRPIIRDLMRKKQYTSFLIGRNGEFDEYAASLIKEIGKEIGADKYEINLVIPYKIANLEYFEAYYDGIIFPDGVFGAYPKAAIRLRNRWMVEKADTVIVYVEKSFGGAYSAMTYAKRINKHIINLCDTKSDFI